MGSNAEYQVSELLEKNAALQAEVERLKAERDGNFESIPKDCRIAVCESAGLEDKSASLAVSIVKLARERDLALKWLSDPISTEEWDVAIEENSDGDVTDYQGLLPHYSKIVCMVWQGDRSWA